VFLQHRRQLVRYVRSLLPSDHDPLDVLQEVALRLLARSKVPVPIEALPAWCNAVARRIVLHQLRAARYEQSKLTALSVHRQIQSGGHEHRSTSRLLLARYLSDVDDTEQEMLLRRYILQQTSFEVGRAMKLSPAAVRMRLMRLRQRLVPSDA